MAYRKTNRSRRLRKSLQETGAAVRKRLRPILPDAEQRRQIRWANAKVTIREFFFAPFEWNCKTALQGLACLLLGFSLSLSFGLWSRDNGAEAKLTAVGEIPEVELQLAARDQEKPAPEAFDVLDQ